MHYGVKGMKWGVRHDKPSVGRRYSAWGRKTSNKMYDKMASNVESRRQKNKSENWAKNSKNKTVSRYGNWVDRTSDKKYDKEIKKIEDRRQRKNQEFDEFDRMLDAKDKAVKTFNEKTKGLKLTPEQKKTAKKIAIGAAVVAGVGLATYGGVKVAKLHNTRSLNKAIVAKYLNDNAGFDIAARYGPNQTRISPTHTILNTTNIHNTKYGPSMRVTRSEVYKPSTSTGRNPLLFKKEATSKVIGVNGKPRTIKKSDIKKYRKMYDTVYKQYAR